MTTWHPDLSARRGPKYGAIADALSRDIANGQLAAGTRLPTHRDLAWRLGVTVGTVSRAYAEAERSGLVQGEVGRGTFVRGATARDEIRFPHLADHASPASRRTDLSYASPPMVPDDGALPRLFREVAAAPDAGERLHYQPSLGDPGLRQAAAGWLARRDIPADPERLAITAGGQHAMLVALAAIAQPGDRIFIEEVTYQGIFTTAQLLGLKLEPLAMDRDGLLPDALEKACRRTKARGLYLIPTLHNPTTATLPAARRTAILEIARRHGLPIVEDDVFGYLGSSPAPLAALDCEQVLYLTSLSKCLAPGLRTGFLHLPKGLVTRATRAIEASCLTTSGFLGEVARRAITGGVAEDLLAKRLAAAARRRALCLDLLGPWGPACPEGSVIAWLPLPAPWRGADFAAAAARRGVRVTAAERFVATRETSLHAVRIGFGNPASESRLEEALATLRDLLENEDLATGEAVV